MTGSPDDTSYLHSQAAPSLPALLAVVTVVTAVTLVIGESPVVMTVLLTALLASVTVIGWSLSKLTVAVAGTTLIVAFRFGRPEQRFDVRELTAVRQVRNHWLHGWGVRWIKNGRMYNVWGLDAVELELRSGKVFRIGTDEPEALLAAIRSARS